jgi:hypothetical protein
VNTNESFNQKSADLNVGHVLHNAIEDISKSTTDIGKTLILTKQRVLLRISNHNLNLVPNLSIFKIPLDQSVVNLGVSDFAQGLEKHVHGDQELLFVVNELHHAVAVDQVVHGDGLGEHVITHASHLHCVGRKHFASVDEGGPLERNRVISFVHNQHSHNSLISIDNKIPAKFKTIFFHSGQLFRI